MTERRKWMILTGLVAVLGITLVLRLGHRPHATAGEPATVTTGEGDADAGSNLDATPAADDAVTAATALELAKALLERPALESVLPRRDLFAPGRGESWSPSDGSGHGDAGGSLPGPPLVAAVPVRESPGMTGQGPAGEPGRAAEERRDDGEAVRPGGAGDAAREAGRDRETGRVTAPTPGPLALTATFQDGAVRMALLGGRLVREGDAIRGGYVLSRVEEDRVTLTRGNDVLVVDMPAR